MSAHKLEQAQLASLPITGSSHEHNFAPSRLHTAADEHRIALGRPAASGQAGRASGQSAVRLILAGPASLTAMTAPPLAHGGETAWIASVEQGIHFLSRYIPPRDLHGDPLPAVLLLEQALPGNSLKLLRWLRGSRCRARNLPVVCLQEPADLAWGRAALGAGANSVITKTSDPLRQTEHQALLARYWLDLNIAPPDPCEIFQR